jgi:hypothetical protein
MLKGTKTIPESLFKLLYKVAPKMSRTKPESELLDRIEYRLIKPEFELNWFCILDTVNQWLDVVHSEPNK